MRLIDVDGLIVNPRYLEAAWVHDFGHHADLEFRFRSGHKNSVRYDTKSEAENALTRLFAQVNTPHIGEAPIG